MVAEFIVVHVLALHVAGHVKGSLFHKEMSCLYIYIYGRGRQACVGQGRRCCMVGI